MKALLVLVISILLGIKMSRASLGETDAQIEARYGPARGGPHSGTGCYSKTYFCRSMYIVVVFVDGKSEYERFDTKDPFLATDIDALLIASTLTGSSWYRSYEDKLELSAQPKGLKLLFDRRVIAEASVSDYAVIITSEKYQRLYLHAGNYSWPPERLNVPDGSSR